MTTIRFLLSFLFLLTVKSSITVTRLPIPPPYGGYTEELWVYFNKHIPDSFLTILSSNAGYSLRASSLKIDLVKGSSTLGSISTQSISLPIKLKHWINIAVTYYVDGPRSNYTLYVNGFDCGMEINDIPMPSISVLYILLLGYS